VPVALDAVAYMFGQFIALQIEPGLNFGSHILRNVLGSTFEAIECDDAKLIVELMSRTRLAQHALRLEISLKKLHCIGDRLRSNRCIKPHRIPGSFLHARAEEARVERLCLLVDEKH
jgi:hypothetical protein